MSFSQLPAELQIQIFSYLRVPDLKSARGVCRRFRDHASVSLFRSIVACARYQAMGAFQKVALHSVYPTYVKEIIFDGSMYDGGLANNEYAYQQRADDFEDLRGVVSWARRSRFKRYQELYKEQEDIKNGHVLLQTIARALEWMPNVFSIVYSPGPHHIPGEAKLMKETIPRGVIATHSSFLTPRRGKLQDGIHHVIGAVYIAQYTGIREFKVEPARHNPSKPGTEFTLCAFDFEEPGHLEAGKYFFRHLHKLELSLSLLSPLGRGAAPVGREALDCLANMAALLLEAKDLRDLKLHLAHYDVSPQRMYGHIIPHGQPIYPFLGLGAKWPNLRSLSLEGIYAEEEDLKDLISRHKETLVSLQFSFCSLFSGKWSNIVDDVVYTTNILPFVLGRVHETTIRDVPFSNIPDDEAERWQYEGQVQVNAEGERYFDEPPDKSVYAWRNQGQVEA